jgi:hypothetical protein
MRLDLGAQRTRKGVNEVARSQGVAMGPDRHKDALPRSQALDCRHRVRSTHAPNETHTRATLTAGKDHLMSRSLWLQCADLSSSCERRAGELGINPSCLVTDLPMERNVERMVIVALALAKK